jgi:PGF-CTERM protein
MNTASAGALLLAVVVVLGATAGASAGASTDAARTGDLGTAATVDATPSDPNEADSTHAVVVSLGSEAESPGSTFNDVVVDYAVGKPEADVSNVGAGTIERIGIDRGGDDRGTRVDVRANVTTVSGKRDGGAVRIATNGALTLQQGDEVVVVMRPVQNPQNAGSAEVEVTVNSQSANDTATGTVTYEYNDASVAFANQSTTGGTVTVSSVTLSEAGFVTVQNASGARPDEIRGHSDYLPAGTHEDVTVRLDTPIERDRELVAQAYTDANANYRFEYDVSGGEEDFPYRNRDGNLMGTDIAQVTHTTDSGGDTATPTPTPAPDGTATPTPSPSDGGDGSDGGDATPTDTATPIPADGDDGSGDGSGDDATPTPTPPEETRTGTADGDATPATATHTDTDRAGAVTPTATPTPVTDGTATPTVTSPTAADTPTEPPADGTETGGQPGFGTVATLVALVGAALLARRAA